MPENSGMATRFSLFLLFFFSACAWMAGISCSKQASQERGTARIQIWLTDDPGNYQALWLDIQDVQVNRSGGDAWQSVNGVNRGQYNVMALVNGHDTIVADAEIPAGRLRQVRLILGTENFVQVNDTLIKLNTTGVDQSGLQVPVLLELNNATSYKITLDFDVSASVVQVDSLHFDLKPSIRTIFESVGGSVQGRVQPADIKTAIMAIQGSDTIGGTFTDSDGGYLLKGLAEGSYSLYFNPSSAVYRDSLVNEVIIINKQVTVLDTMRLQQ